MRRLFPFSIMDTENATSDHVTVEKLDGVWVVRVVQDGEILQRDFETEDWANSFAEGQRARLAASQPNP